MTWSEWIEYGTKARPGTRLKVEFINGGAGSAYEDAAAPAGDAYLDDSLNNQRGYQWSAPADWASWRDWFPPALAGLEEGVDYGVRPDRTADDVDAYVQYEAGDNVHVGWERPLSRVSQVVISEGTTMAFEVATWASSYQAGPIGAWPGGSVFYTGNQSTPWGADLPNPPDLTPAKAFTIAPRVTARDSGAASVSIQHRTEARIILRLPRYRYWIPGEVPVFPLRQKQRNDGLARGVYRARSTSSIQNSVRQNSYR